MVAALARPCSVAEEPLEVIFLGTGTSSSLPNINCLTKLPDGELPCRACISTLTPEGKKNIRRNTSVVVRTRDKNGQQVTILIDAGKNFQAAAVEWFPKYGLRKIDGVLITHSHADAMNGLDDLRAWTLGGAIQPYIDIYLAQETFIEVQRSFPYLVSKEFASGGGDVPEFKWHIINDKIPFELQDSGIYITPFAVHHGRIFSKVPPPGYLVTPNATLPSTPINSSVALLLKHSSLVENGSKNDQEETVYPYLCYGFKIKEDILYLSDVSYIPDDVWPILETRSLEDRPVPVAIVDCLRLRPHTSHYGIAQAVDTAQRINATRTYLTGFGHEVAHDEYVTIGKYVGGAEKLKDDWLTETEREGIKLVEQQRGIWLRPAYDGLRVIVGNTESVWDDAY